MYKRQHVTVMASFLVGQAVAVDIINDGLNRVVLGGYIGLQCRSQDNKINADNDSARINFTFEQKVADALAGFARAEWGYKAHNQYVNDRGVLQEKPLFNNRQGYLGLKHRNYGRVTIGKQPSVYSDVAGWSDRYAISGGAATGINNGFTSDGGFSGTGRADDAISWRNSLDGLSVAFQYQLPSERYAREQTLVPAPGDIRREYGYQLAVSQAWTELGLSVGMAFNNTCFNLFPSREKDEDNLLYARAVVAGVRYDRAGGYGAITYGQFRNHTTVQFGKNTAVTTATDSNRFLDPRSDGVEFYGRYRVEQLVGGGFSLQAGWSRLRLLNDRARCGQINRLMLGTLYELGAMQFAGEYTWDKSRHYSIKDKKYQNATDVLRLQVRYHF